MLLNERYRTIFNEYRGLCPQQARSWLDVHTITEALPTDPLERQRIEGGSDRKVPCTAFLYKCGMALAAS